MLAQDRINIHGGERPNAKLLPLLKKYSRDAELSYNKKIPKIEWIVELEKYYGL